MRKFAVGFALALVCGFASVQHGPAQLEAQTTKAIPQDNEGRKAIAELRALIRKQQRLNVRESYGEWAYQCFTWIDLDEFKSAEKPAQIARSLKSSSEIARIVSIIKVVPIETRNKLLDECRRPLRPTWAQLGRISSEGQTEAGQQAERLIADAIVDMVISLTKRAPEPGGWS